MRRSFRFVLSTLVIALAGAACAGGGGGSNGVSDQFRDDMGRLLARPLDDAQIEFWNKHQIPLFRREIRDRSLMYESSWMERQPTSTELAAGVFGARNRVFIRGRMVEQGLDPDANVFRVTFQVENQIQTDSITNWHPGPMPAEALTRFRALLSDMKLELNTGVRR